jgi:hypothetical protein
MTSISSDDREKTNVQHAEVTTSDESQQVLDADEAILRSLGYKQVRRYIFNSYDDQTIGFANAFSVGLTIGSKP